MVLLLHTLLLLSENIKKKFFCVLENGMTMEYNKTSIKAKY